MNEKIIIHKYKSSEVFQRANELLINYIKLYHNITQKTLLLLSGGSAVELYKPLAKFIRESDLDWKFLKIAQVDERYIGEKSEFRNPKSEKISKYQNSKFNNKINALSIEKTGLWEACRERKIPYFVISQEEMLDESTEQYNRVLMRLFKDCVYKIAVFGLGEDGHTAGLLPGYRKDWNNAKLVAGYINSGRFKQRISITPKAIKMLDQVIIVAVGNGKKQIIAKLTTNNQQLTTKLNEFPAMILREIPQVDLFVDRLE